jgi:hypothetical protein
MSFRQVKFIVKRGDRSPLFTLDTRLEIEEKLQNLLLQIEEDENILDIPNLVTDRFTHEDESTKTQYNIIAPHVSVDLNLQEIKQKLNNKFRHDNFTFDYEIVGGKRRSSKRKPYSRKRRSSKRTSGGKRRNSKRTSRRRA